MDSNAAHTQEPTAAPLSKCDESGLDAMSASVADSGDGGGGEGMDSNAAHIQESTATPLSECDESWLDAMSASVADSGDGGGWSGDGDG